LIAMPTIHFLSSGGLPTRRTSAVSNATISTVDSKMDSKPSVNL
jgi:hypothetical protein